MRYLALTLIVCVITFNVRAEEIKQNLVMGFIPNRNINAVQISAQKIAEFLSKETGYNIKAMTVSNYASIVFGMKSKRIDLAFVGPLNYVILNKNTGAYPLTSAIRFGKHGYYSLVITRKDSDIKKIEDLKGKKFVFGDVLSTSSTLYPKKMIKEAGLDLKKDIKSAKLDNASAIVLSVMQGTVDAGSVYKDARKNSEVLNRFPNILDETIVIAESELIPPDPQIVGKHISKKQAEILKKGLIAISKKEESKKILKSLFLIDELVPANDKDYDGLRKVILSVNPELL